MTEIRRASERYRSQSPGITSWHCFSAGAYFDPDNVGFGPVVACDEHLLDPGAGFEPHAHAGVELISWVLDGTLAHWDQAGRQHLIPPGRAQYQLAGAGIRHAERNASRLEPLHFVQFSIMTDVSLPAYDVSVPPLTLSVGRFDVLTRCRGTRLDGSLIHLFVGLGNFHVAGTDLGAGDSVRAVGPVEIDGAGELLVVSVDS